MTKKKTPLAKMNRAQLMLWLSSVDKKTVIQVVIFLFVFLGFIFFFFLPMVAQNAKVGSENKKLELKIHSARGKIARMPEMKQQKEKYGDRIAEVRSQFFKSSDTDRLIEIISTTATNSGVRISASRPSKTEFELPAAFAHRYIALSYDLKEFHYLLYNYLSDHGLNDDFLKIQSPHVLNFLNFLK